MTTQLKACSFTPRTLKAGLCALLTAGMLMSSFVLPASAQPDQNPAATTESVGNTESAGNAAAASQLADMLTSPVAEERIEALHQVTDLAYHRPEVDLSPTVPVLVEIYRGDPEEGYRLAAVAALHAIGDEDGMQQVRRLVYWQSRKVQNVSLAALLDYYGPLTFEGDGAAAAVAEEQIERNLEAQEEADEPVVAERQ